MRKLRLPVLDHNLSLLLICQAVTTLGMMTVVPVMPLYIASLSQSGAAPDPAAVLLWSNLALAAPGLGTLCCAPLAGRLCERFGYRRMLLLSLLAFVASMLAMALSQEMLMFIAGRLLQGISTIGLILTVFIGRISESSTRGRNFGLQESAIAAGSLLGPVVGGLMLDHWSLRPMLMASAVVTALAGAMLWSRTREPAKAAENANADTGPMPGFRGLRSILHHSDLRCWALAACLAQAAGFAMLTVFAQFIPTRFPGLEAPASAIGSLHALGWLATMLAGPAWGRINDRGDPRRNFLLAAAGCAASSALLMACGQLWMVALMRLLQGACYAALAQSMLLACLRQLPPSANGHFTGLSRSFMVMGQLLGPLLVILFSPLLAPQHLPWLVSLLFICAGLLVWQPGRSASHSQQI